MSSDNKEISGEFNRGLELFKNRKFAEAERIFAKIFKLKPEDILINFFLGATYFENRKFSLSKEKLTKVISIEKNHRDANFLLGMISYDEEKFNSAKIYLEKIYKSNTSDTNVANLFAKVLIKTRDFHDAITILRKELDKKPNDFDIINNLGYAYLLNSEVNLSIKFLSKALKLNSNSSYTYANLGTSYFLKNELLKSKKIYKKGLEIFPENNLISFAFSLSELSDCNFDDGFKLYEKRKNNKDYRLNFIKNHKEWKGEDLNGKVIYIISEQGIGDILQFSRYLISLKKKYSVKIIFAVNKNLKHLFNFDDIDIVEKDTLNIKFDYFQYLLSLPGIFFKLEKKFAENTNFIKTNYIILNKWTEKIKNIKGPKIGFNFQGDTSYILDGSRSVPLELFKDIFLINRLNFISLVKGSGEIELDKIILGKNVFNFSKDIDNNDNSFEDTIAILKNLDLIITSDTAIAHLASTMEIKTWLLLNFSPDWRWHINMKYFKWYKNLRIFRQDSTLRWDKVIEEVISELNKNF